MRRHLVTRRRTYSPRLHELPQRTATAVLDEPEGAHECQCDCGCAAVAGDAGTCSACTSGDCLFPEYGGES